jgi:hypothetical protein
MSEKEYVEISPALLTVHAAERTATEVEAAVSGIADRWWFAITDTHLALTSALVETLGGSMGIGAMAPKQRALRLAYLTQHRHSSKEKAPADERIARFDELLERALDPANVGDMGGTLALSKAEKADVLKLNDFRNDVIHIKQLHWSLEVAGLPRIVGAAAEAMRQLFQMSPLRAHLAEEEVERAENAIDRILASVGRAAASTQG